MKPPEPGLVDGMINQLSEFKDSAQEVTEGPSATDYVTCVEKMTEMYSAGQG